MTEELYKVYRPKKLDDVVGQDIAVNILQKFLDRKKIPHSLLVTGPSGCGKTTLARILKDELNCSDMDFTEINCAEKRGIDMVRNLRNTAHLKPLEGGNRIFLIDEVHQLTGAGQEAALKILEDTPKHAYFILCTTNPEKLKTTIRTRCTDIKVDHITSDNLSTIVQKVSKKEKIKLNKEVLSILVEASYGSARQALVFLDAIQDLKKGEQIDYIQKQDVQKAAEFLGRVLLKEKSSWKMITDSIVDVKRNDVEGVRQGVLGYMSSCLNKGGYIAQRAYIVISSFQDNFFDSGRAGLLAACWEVHKGI